jgi:transposase-like protein
MDTQILWLLGGFGGLVLFALVCVLVSEIQKWIQRRRIASLPRVTLEKPCPYCGSDDFVRVGQQFCRCGHEVYVQEFVPRCPTCGKEWPDFGESWCPKCGEHLWTGTVVQLCSPNPVVRLTILRDATATTPGLAELHRIGEVDGRP